jgi:hypothetical protein
VEEESKERFYLLRERKTKREHFISLSKRARRGLVFLERESQRDRQHSTLWRKRAR